MFAEAQIPDGFAGFIACVVALLVFIHYALGVFKQVRELTRPHPVPRAAGAEWVTRDELAHVETVLTARLDRQARDHQELSTYAHEGLHTLRNDLHPWMMRIENRLGQLQSAMRLLGVQVQTQQPDGSESDG